MLDGLVLPKLPQRLIVLECSTLQHRGLLACKCRTRLCHHSQFLALARFGQAPVLQCHNVGQALHLSLEQASSKPSVEHAGPALQERPSKAILPQSCTAPEDQKALSYEDPMIQLQNPPLPATSASQKIRHGCLSSKCCGTKKKTTVFL